MKKRIDTFKERQFVNEGLEEKTFNSALYSKHEVISILEDLYVEVAKLYNEQDIPVSFLREESKTYIKDYVKKYTK